MATLNRQTKRRFQPSITSYFAGSDRSTSPPSSAASHASPLSPPLPATIQSSLLNVGMRVRKSVPGGYKTTSCDISKQTNRTHGSSAAVVTSGLHNNSNYRSGSAELTPYCGILKVGGYDSQPLPRTMEATEPLQIGNDDNDFVSSQDSNSSTDTAFIEPSQTNNASRKRRLQDEDIFGNVAVWEDDDMLPATVRSIAVPKSRRKWPGTTIRKVDVWKGQENIANDFEEADFLRAPDWIEEEMEMDGF